MYKKRFIKIFLFFVATCFLFSGCAWFQPEKEETAYGLAVEGMDAFKDGDYVYSMELFQKLKDRYPFSKYAILAELKIADCHYYRKEYEDAIFWYEEFEKLHPENEAVPYVIYQTGLCYLEQLDTIDRDQTPAQQAIKIFEKLVRHYPQSEYSNAARQHIKICVKSLAEHDFYVGLFYYKSKHYKAALERFGSVVRDYPDVGVHYKALQYIPLCRAKL
jgi:outer membrane protein assembly factor BamD